MENTRDISLFGYREKEIAADLLKAQGSSVDNTQFLGDGVSVEFNPMSGSVFLVDENYNVAMLNGELLEDWLNCPECGEEGFKEELKDSPNDCCKEYLKELE